VGWFVDAADPGLIGAEVEEQADGPAAVEEIGAELGLVLIGEAAYLLDLDGHDVVDEKVEAVGVDAALAVSSGDGNLSADGEAALLEFESQGAGQVLFAVATTASAEAVEDGIEGGQDVAGEIRVQVVGH